MRNKYLIISIRFLMIIAFLIFGNSGYCQFDENASSLVPSPNASSIITYANTPVNLYTGVPTISADLYNLKARGEYTIPLKLFYHASGIKVQDIASTVGIGWSPGYNSLITRVVRGVPDEGTNGYFGSDMGNKITQPLDATTLNGILDGDLDAEPDLFFFNINGRYGKFVFNKDKNPVMIADNGIRIINSPFKKELGADGWILEDLQGNMFYLGTDDNCTENTQSILHAETSDKNKVFQFTSSWYLKKIVAPNNTEIINYNYDTGSQTKVTYYNRRAKSRTKITTTYDKGFEWLGITLADPSVSTAYQIVDADEWSDNIDEVVANPKYLISITSSNQNAYFYYDTQNPRQDLTDGRVLNKIEIKNYKDELLKYFVFNQDYIYSKDIDRLEDMTFQVLNYCSSQIDGFSDYYYNQAPVDLSDATKQLQKNIEILSETEYEAQLRALIERYRYEDQGLPNISITVPPLTYSPDKYRLRLNSITMFSGDQSSSVPLYRFQYNETFKLPPRYSRKSDNWGYYNNNTYGYFPIQVNPYSTYGLVNQNINAKLSDAERMKANILQKIIYETGGYKDFILEANQYFNPTTNTNQIAGGLRVAKIISVGDINTYPIVEKYTYTDNSGNSTGKLLSPVPAYVSYIEHSENQIVYPFIPWSPPANTITNPYNPSILPPTDFIQPPAKISSGSILESFVVSFFNMFFWDNTVTHISYTPFIVRSSTSFNSLFDLDGNAIGYSKVTIENNGEGKTVNQFTDRDDYPDMTNQLRVDGNFNPLGRISPNASPYTPSTSYSFARGHLKESCVYDKNSNLLKRITNNYDLKTLGENVKGFKVAIGKINTTNGAFQSYSNAYYNIGYYNIISQALVLKQTIQESFEPNYITPVTNTINYTYNDTYPSLISNQIIDNSDGSSISTDFKHVIDKDQVTYLNQSETDAANQLYNDGKYGLILNQTIKRNNEIVNTSKTGYKNWTVNNKQLVLPETIYQSNGSTLEPKLQYYAYDENGNVLQLSRDKGAKITTLWNYNNLYPVAECKNGGPQEVFFEDFENTTGNNIMTGNAHSGSKYFNGPYTVNFNIINSRLYKLSYWYHLAGSWHFSGYVSYTGTAVLNQGDAIDDVVIIPVDAQLTSYTYNPLVGITSMSNANRASTLYSYDKLQRLTDVRDNAGNIVKHFDYNEASAPLPQVYFNSEKVVNFFNNDCSIGTYTVPKEKYFTYTNQSDADSKAQTDVNTYKQINSNGSCPIYARVEIRNIMDHTQDNDDLFADIYVRFYMDANCTIPYILPSDMAVSVDDLYTRFGYSPVDNQYSYIVKAGTSEIYIGNLNVYYYTYWYDEYGTCFWDQSRSEFKLLSHTGSSYIPLPTSGATY